MSKKCLEREEARFAGKTTYFTGKPCKYGHVAERLTSTRMCVTCSRERRMVSYYKNNHKELSKQYARKRREEDPRKERNRAAVVRLKYKYGLNTAEYEVMFARQSGRCAICDIEVVSQLDTSRPLQNGRGAPKNDVARVDHCHDSGAVRGLLCSNCNILLGKAKDSEVLLLSAVRYLRESATVQRDSRIQHDTLKGESGPESRDPYRTVSRGSRRDELSPFIN